MSSANPKPQPQPVPKYEAPEADPKPEPSWTEKLTTWLKFIFSGKPFAWIKLSISIVVAVAFMIAGVVLSTATNRVAGSATVHSVVPILSSSPESYGAEVMSAVFAVTATIITEAIGSVRSITSRYSMIKEGTQSFNTNSLFAASTGWANGRLMSSLMALLLVISYAASALVVMRLETSEGPDHSIIKYETGLGAPPIIVFGLSLFLQGVISLIGTYYCDQEGWLQGTDILAATKARINNHTINPRPHRCMRNVLQGQSTTPDPLKPSVRQPSALRANPTVRKAIIVMWGMIPFYTIWGAIAYALSIYASTWVSRSGSIRAVGIGSTKLSEFSWTFLPNNNTQSFGVTFLTTNAKDSGSLPSAAWPSILFVFAVIQSGLTLVLTYCEVIINTIMDEHAWRQAMGHRGVSTSEPEERLLRVARELASSSWQSVCLLVTKPFRPTPNTTQDEDVGRQVANWRRKAYLLQRIRIMIISNKWRSMFLRVAKAFCHWLFGQSFNVFASFTGSNFIGIEVVAHCAQIWYLSAVLVVFATIMTLIANYKPLGPLPAAYGHFQTLADLIDEWPPEESTQGYKMHPVLYWGHKSDKDGVCHAGTSPDRSLVCLIIMDGMYGGGLDPEWPSTAARALTYGTIILLLAGALVNVSALIRFLTRPKHRAIKLTADDEHKHDPFDILTPRDLIDGHPIDEEIFWAKARPLDDVARYWKLALSAALAFAVAADTIALAFAVDNGTPGHTLAGLVLRALSALYRFILAYLSMLTFAVTVTLFATAIWSPRADVDRRRHVHPYDPSNGHTPTRLDLHYDPSHIYAPATLVLTASSYLVLANTAETEIGTGTGLEANRWTGKRGNVCGIAATSDLSYFTFSCTTRVVMLGHASSSLEIGDLPSCPGTCGPRPPTRR
ncbi:hypothetical protein FIBSPDRAFT_950635 [Athelia psychrophila]|uniref:Uncharacterized protein n=1 Tax=Athelia psychrophila TaxID=1759441 RepID=A0A166NEB2_9AGAM|nr:hypothetical protein FIBSPDRAFT_950635 [Fibularhizoctonia sp. CBS 109695]